MIRRSITAQTARNMARNIIAGNSEGYTRFEQGYAYDVLTTSTTNVADDLALAHDLMKVIDPRRWVISEWARTR